MELVSVIVPVYKAEQYLERCIRSLINQSYKALELILVDDGSPDKCGEICDSFLYDDRVVVIHQKNMGASAARNSGIETANGEWITFVDSDDFVAETYIESLLGLCKSYNVNVSQCRAIIGIDDSFPQISYKPEPALWTFDSLYMSHNREYRSLVWGKLYKKTLFSDIRFPIGKIYEDEDVAFKILFKAGRAVLSNERLYYYYQSPNSIMRGKKEHVCFDFLDIFEERIQFIKENNAEHLLDTTYKELCIRAMMKYCYAISDNMPHVEIAELRRVFIEYYKAIREFSFSKKETLAIRIFYIVPHIFAFLENNLHIIAKNSAAQNNK